MRLALIGFFTLLTVLSARLRVEFGGAVPFTMQVLAILLAGLVLGSRDGALSQVAYLSLIMMNLPVDTRMMGAAAFAGPTAGFLVGFPVLAYVTGFLAERGGKQVWVRWLAGLAGIAVLYLFGAAWLLAASDLSLSAVWANAVAPFILLDAAKAIIAAGLAEGGRALITRL
jgi:biotin transport system substrate-specific component